MNNYIVSLQYITYTGYIIAKNIVLVHFCSKVFVCHAIKMKQDSVPCRTFKS